jgi:hypothetical protein
MCEQRCDRERELTFRIDLADIAWKNACVAGVEKEEEQRWQVLQALMDERDELILSRHGH